MRLNLHSTTSHDSHISLQRVVRTEASASESGLIFTLIPVDDIHQFPRILTQLPLQLAIVVNDELRCRIQHPGTLVLILIVNINLASSQVESLRLCILEGLPEGNPAIGNKTNPTARGCGDC